MTSLVKTAVNLTVLPGDLLTLAKSHMRVDGTYDDVYITQALARAINWFERQTQISVNPVTWIWTPAATRFCDGAAAVPVTPVNSFTVSDGAAVPADISASFTLRTTSTYGIALYYLAGVHVTGMAVTIPSGYDDADLIDAGIVDAVLRYAEHLYQNREILVPGSEAQTPGWMTADIATFWKPRV